MSGITNILRDFIIDTLLIIQYDSNNKVIK